MSTNRFYSFYRHGKRFDITMFNDDEFRTLLGHLDRPWQGYRKVRKGVKKRLSRRMDEIGCRTIADYLEVLNRSPEEKDACEQCLLVTISRYFRDRQLWQTLKERLLPLLVKRFEPPIRIWCAGCACGEEAYSLAIVLDSMENSPIVELLATDTQNACLDRAGKGLYSHSSLKEVPVDLRAAYFVSMRGGRSFKIRKNRLPPIQWQQHNLLDPPPPGPFQMILMRNNLLTYHQGPLLRAAFDRITATLPPGGYLVVGSHEKLPASASTFIRDPQCPWVYSMNHL